MNVAFVPERTRISVDRYQKMIAANVFTASDRIQLIEGELIDMAPIGPLHVSLTARLTKFFILGVGDAAFVSPGGPVNLGEFSQPQPDLLLLQPRSDDYATQNPAADDVLLAIEISDTTLAFDQGIKRTLYARHGVREYWIIDVQGKRIHVYRDPSTDGYRQARAVSVTESVSPLALPAIQLTVKTLFT